MSREEIKAAAAEKMKYAEQLIERIIYANSKA